MTSRIPIYSRRLCLMVLATLASACGGGDSPTEPPTPPPASATLVIDYRYIEVIDDCDGIEGDGDFLFTVTEERGRGESNRWEVYSRRITLGPGGRTGPLGRRSAAIAATDGNFVGVIFRAWEWDQGIDHTWPDDRLAGHYRRSVHVIDQGSWSNLGAQSLTLGVPGCQVRLHWVATAG